MKLDATKFADETARNEYILEVQDELDRLEKQVTSLTDNNKKLTETNQRLFLRAGGQLPEQSTEDQDLTPEQELAKLKQKIKEA